MHRPQLGLTKLATLVLIQVLGQSRAEYAAPQPNGTFVFFEPFNQDFSKDGRWVTSKDPKYDGTWLWAAAETLVGASSAEDKGLLQADYARHSAIASRFAEPLKAGKGRDLVVQYEVKLQNKLECGGAYIKLLHDSPDLDLETFHDKTRFVIMFGPDRCGYNDRVHFIFQHQNPVSGVWEEKHLEQSVPIKNDKKTHLYTLIVRQDNSFEILIDLKSVKKGNLLTDFAPPVNPPKEIDDPEDKKPDDWVDEDRIPDPNAVKPADWDETEPREIPDMDAVKPAGWLDDEPAEIPDPNAKRPEDWDEDEDGSWEAPLISNPACAAVGCGEWKPPMLPNPKYRGKWAAPKIPNPAYKGPWAPRKIPNPHYFEDREPAWTMAGIAAVGVEIWAMQHQILFDNFLLGYDVDAALEYGRATWKPKIEAERLIEPDSDEDSESFFSKVLTFLDEQKMVISGVVGAAMIFIPMFLVGRRRPAAVDAPRAPVVTPATPEAAR